MNEKAVSPVIGVILMVAIVVILAAVIAAFIFGMAASTGSHVPENDRELHQFLFTGPWYEENRTIQVIGRNIGDHGYYYVWDESGEVYRCPAYGTFSMIRPGENHVRIEQLLTKTDRGFLYYMPEILEVYEV